MSNRITSLKLCLIFFREKPISLKKQFTNCLIDFSQAKSRIDRFNREMSSRQRACHYLPSKIIVWKKNYWMAEIVSS